MNELIKSVSYELIATLILTTAGWLRVKFLTTLSKNNPRLPGLLFFLLLFVWVLANAGAFYLQIAHHYSIYWLLTTVLLTSALIFAFSWYELNQFWEVGIVGADQHVKSGIDYKKSLNMVRNRFAFLGTGASKLTSDSDFEAALERCHSDQPIQFLLVRPNDSEIAEAERRAGKQPGEYTNQVKGSLRKIAELRNRRFSNIEVRFYPSSFNIVPVLRLVFIDDALCLMSYNAFGKGDGSQLPQIHIVKDVGNKSVDKSFYFALDQYFQWLWKESEQWNFEQYLND